MKAKNVHGISFFVYGRQSKRLKQTLKNWGKNQTHSVTTPRTSWSLKPNSFAIFTISEETSSNETARFNRRISSRGSVMMGGVGSILELRV